MSAARAARAKKPRRRPAAKPRPRKAVRRAAKPKEPPSVVVTRDEPSDGPLSSKLRELGLTVLSWQVVRVGPPADGAPLEDALAHAGKFDWIVFASRHAVQAVTSRLRSPPLGVRIAAVGESTGESLRAHGWPTHIVPRDTTAAGLVAALAPSISPGTRVLFPASSRALPTLGAGLKPLGAEVVQVEAYCTDSAPLDLKSCLSFIDRELIAAVTFTSPSTVIELHRSLGATSFDRLLSQCAAVALGPTTARALAERGHTATLAEPPSLEGLALTTLRILQTRP